MNRLLVFALLFSLASCGAAEQRFDNETYEKTKESLEEKERKNPRQFLEVSSSDRKNLIGQTVVRGTVANKASVCSYKDIELKIAFFSKTGVLLEEVKETVYEEIAPNSSAKFKSKNFAPKGTDSVSIKIVSAKPINK